MNKYIEVDGFTQEAIDKATEQIGETDFVVLTFPPGVYYGTLTLKWRSYPTIALGYGAILVPDPGKAGVHVIGGPPPLTLWQRFNKWLFHTNPYPHGGITITGFTIDGDKYHQSRG